MIQLSGDGFWATVELLVDGLNDSTHVDPLKDDIEDWLEAMTTKVKLLRARLMKPTDVNSEESSCYSENYITLIDCSFSNPPVRSRLESLMGSNVVRLTDRKYMLRLVSRMRQDYELRQQNRIEERKKNELMRTKMMILNRLISVHDAPVEIRQYPLFQLYLYCDAIVEQKRKTHSLKRKKISSLYRILFPDEKKDEKSEENEEIYMKRVYVDGVPELVPMSKEETIAAKRDLEAAKDIEDGYMLSQKEYDRLHYEAEAIKDLRKTQEVEEMYAKAHDILGILYSHVDSGRYKRRPPKVIEQNNSMNEQDTDEPEQTESNQVNSSRK